MTFNLSKFFGVCAIASGIALGGCNQDKAAQQTAAPVGDAPAAETIKVGVMAGPEQAVAEVATKWQKINTI